MISQHNIEEQAATWLVRRGEPAWTDADETALQHWLAESDYHKVAFWRLEHGWREADRIACIGASSLSETRSSAAGQKWGVWAGIAAMAASIALVLNVVPLPQFGLPFAGRQVATAQFATDVGSRKIVSLSDGSQIELNTATVIRASLSDSGREVWLDRGEAYFSVVKRQGSSFLVHAGGDKITVVGTKFSVRRDGPSVFVSVLEGRVRVDVPVREGITRSAMLSQGEIAQSQRGMIAVEKGAESIVESQLAWRKGMLVFNDVPLEKAAEEFNRYNRQQLVITDPASRRIRIGGSFRATNVEEFARLLEDAYGLDVTVSADRISVSG